MHESCHIHSIWPKLLCTALQCDPRCHLLASVRLEDAGKVTESGLFIAKVDTITQQPDSHRTLLRSHARIEPNNQLSGIASWSSCGFTIPATN
jgi:hypothetical protein